MASSDDDLWEFGKELGKPEESQPEKKWHRIYLAIDNRERADSSSFFYDLIMPELQKAFGDTEAERMLKKRNLPAGDFCFYGTQRDGSEELLFIYERKTWPDLQASWNDGRLETQKDILMKMNQEQGVRFAYIFEGSPGAVLDKYPTAETLRDYMFELEKATIPKVLTSCVPETISHLLRMYDSLKRPEPLHGCYYKHMYGKSNKLPQNYFADCLSLIRGVGYEKAYALAAAFKNHRNLALLGYGNIRDVVVQGKTKHKVGKALEARILECVKHEAEEPNDALVAKRKNEDDLPDPKRRRKGKTPVSKNDGF
jgi:ERCC4-type nuclease